MKCINAEMDNRIQLEFDSRDTSAKAGIRPSMGSTAGREVRLRTSGSKSKILMNILRMWLFHGVPHIPDIV